MPKLNRKILVITLAALLSGCAAVPKTVYLPVSFLNATLESGAYFDTSPKARNNLQPMIARIHGPATMPNDYTSSIVEGCYVTLEGYGNLSTERVDLRLNDLLCLDKDGNTTIDQKVTGYVTDETSHIGLAGESACMEWAKQAPIADESHFPCILIKPARKIQIVLTKETIINIKQVK